MRLPPEFSHEHPLPQLTRVRESLDVALRWVTEQELSSLQFRAHLSLTLSALQHGHSETLDAADQHVRQLLLPGVEAISESAVQGTAALRRYDSSVLACEREFAALTAQGETHLRGITDSMRQIHRVLELCGLQHWYHWREPPNPILPSSAAASQPNISPPSGWQLGTPDHSPDALTELCADEWMRAARCWHQNLDEYHQVLRDWRRAQERYDTAAAHLSAALQTTRLGAILAHTARTPTAQVAAVAVGISGALWGRSRSFSPSLTTERQLVAHHFRVSASLQGWNSHADPLAISLRWNTLTPRLQQALIDQAPRVLGNLPGIPPAARDEANRTALSRMSLHPTELTPAQLSAVTALNQLITDAAHPRPGTTTPTAPLQILSADFSNAVPRVAFARGTLETATHTTWLIPGMNNDATHAIRAWNTTANTLYAEQERNVAGGTTHAVVAWLGYDTPNAQQVVSSDVAAAGATRLTQEINASVQSGQKSSTPQYTHVVAHSYGTTVASIALTNTAASVSSFTLLGSAGIDRSRVPRLEHLNVSKLPNGAPAIFAAQSDSDLIAPLGAVLGGRAVPVSGRTESGVGPSLPLVLPGAHMFPVTGNPEQHLAATTGHSTTGNGHSPSFLGITAPQGHGYLDAGTQSLCTVARITTGTPLEPKTAHC